MGLAPYGQPKYVQTIYDHLLDLKPDGTFRLNMDYFDYCTGLTMTNERFHALFGAPPRPPASLLRQEDMDLARRLVPIGKVRFTMRFYAFTSGRRISQAGLVRTFWIYAVNFLWEVLFGRPFSQTHDTDR